MFVLLTGCGGFLGRRIALKLLRRGDQVRGFSRHSYPDLCASGVEPCLGDVTDPSALTNACRGVDAVIHCAAVAGIWGDWNTYHSVNTLGTRHVIDACRSQRVPVLVHCSSPSVTFDGSHQSGIDESAPYPKHHLCHYSHSKALAEQAVLGAHQPGTLHTAALRPHLIWGPDDPHLFPRLIDRARRGRLRIVGDGKNTIDTVHVDNAAAAHVAALDHLRSAKPAGGGRPFFITQGEPVGCWDWIAKVLEIAGVAPPTRRLSLSTAWHLGAVLEKVYRLGGFRGEPPMTRFLAAQLARDHFFDITAAKNLLGYMPKVTTADGLHELQRHWRHD